MKVVLPIAALLAILIAAAVSGGAKSVPVDQDAAAHVAEPYPVAFDPFTGWGVADMQGGASVPGPEEPSVTALQVVEVDAFERYGVEAPPARAVRTVTDPWQSFAEVRAQYGDPGADALAGALMDALPAASTGPVATGAWWDAAPLDAK